MSWHELGHALLLVATRAGGDRERGSHASSGLLRANRFGHLKVVSWLTDTTARPLATERVSADWVGREP